MYDNYFRKYVQYESDKQFFTLEDMEELGIEPYPEDLIIIDERKGKKMNDEEFYAKTLLVYIADSHYKYYDLYIAHIFTVAANDHLIVYSRNKSSGEESIVAQFKNWDYFIIE